MDQRELTLQLCNEAGVGGSRQILIDSNTDRVLGVHIMGIMAGAIIAQAAQAMEFGASSEDIALKCYAHQAHSEVLQAAAMAVTGKPIHMKRSASPHQLSR